MLGVTQQTYARLESNPAYASLERLFRMCNVLGIEMVFSSEPVSSEYETEEASTAHIDSPARREQW
mgnify:CR=1 FL=1